MKASQNIKAAIKRFEGLRLIPYKDSVGVWTVGYGHTGRDVDGRKITVVKANELLEADVLKVDRQLEALNLPALTQNQYDALVDFVFNLGIGNLKSSTLLKRIYARNPAMLIQKEFRKWVYAGKKVLPGLVRRREYEAQLWVK